MTTANSHCWRPAANLPQRRFLGNQHAQHDCYRQDAAPRPTASPDHSCCPDPFYFASHSCRFHLAIGAATADPSSATLLEDAAATAAQRSTAPRTLAIELQVALSQARTRIRRRAARG